MNELMPNAEGDFFFRRHLTDFAATGPDSRGARDSKIGKKWPESSRILDYILS